jgi:RHS repeat-associated protein
VAGGLATFSYGYDNASQLVSATGPEGSRSYSYDGTGQLTGVTGAHPETYSYDDNGNRTLAGYEVGPGNRLSSDGTYEYTGDDEGNLVTKTRVADGARTEFTWDHRQRLTQVLVYDQWGTVLQEERFTYDALDRRIGVWVDADGSGSEAAVQTWTLYDGGNVYADFDGSGALTYRYLYGPALDQLFARVDAAGSDIVWHLSDRQGSVRQLVNTAGTVLDTLTYDSYGNLLSESHPENGDRFKYTGREYDAILGMYYYRARYYAPGVGCFLSEDPLGFAGGDSNLYRYAGNSPANATDPSGMEPSWLTAAERRRILEEHRERFARQPPGTFEYFVAHGLPSIWRRYQEWGQENRRWLRERFPALADTMDYIERVLSTPGVEVTFGGISGPRLPRRPPGPRGRPTTPPRPATPPTPAPTTPPRTGPYGTLSSELAGTGEQAHHLNQNAAFRTVIPRDEGLAIGLRGNAFTERGTPHYMFHQSLESFWDQYRVGGALAGTRPTNAQYGQALQTALEASGFPAAQAADLAALAASQRAAYGLAETTLVPRVPGRLYQR